MAFQQPTRQVVQRARPATVDDHDHIAASPERQPVESQSWVLFSAPTDVTTTSYLSETYQTPPTPGRSLLSDLGSLDTVPRSAHPTDAGPQPSQSAADDASVEDDAELDSLDSHLPDFRSLPGAQDASHQGAQHSLPVLPTHDGLGSFRLPEQPVLSRDAQDQIYQFERFNPRRVRRRLDSVSRSQLDLEHSQHQEEEKRLRIEAWRLGHSRMLVDQVQRETRRRRKSQVPMKRLRRSAEAESDNTWHDEDHVQPLEDENVLESITLKVVRDLLGIDARLLSFLLGGSLPDDTATLPTPRLDNEPLWARLEEYPYHPRFFETLSRELELLVDRLSHHPGAFSTYAGTQESPLPYAGLPVILESGDPPQSSRLTRNSEPSAPDFQPTMQQHSPRPGSLSRATSETNGDEARGDAKLEGIITQDEWEKDLDVKLVFKYLMSRFSGPSESSSSGGGSHGATPTAQDSLAKISRVRQHHPTHRAVSARGTAGFQGCGAGQLSSPATSQQLREPEHAAIGEEKQLLVAALLGHWRLNRHGICDCLAWADGQLGRSINLGRSGDASRAFFCHTTRQDRAHQPASCGYSRSARTGYNGGKSAVASCTNYE